MKYELLDVTLFIKPIEGVALALSAGEARKRFAKEHVKVFGPGDEEDACLTSKKYSRFWKLALGLKGGEYGWCDEEELVSRRLAGFKGKYALITECIDVTADVGAAEELSKTFGSFAQLVPFSLYAVLCKAYAVSVERLEEVLEGWVRA